MSIAQRGTSATGLGNGDTGYHTVDRFKFVEKQCTNLRIYTNTIN
jgi:hypothetical protein